MTARFGLTGFILGIFSLAGCSLFHREPRPSPAQVDLRTDPRPKQSDLQQTQGNYNVHSTVAFPRDIQAAPQLTLPQQTTNLPPKDAQQSQVRPPSVAPAPEPLILPPPPASPTSSIPSISSTPAVPPHHEDNLVSTPIVNIKPVPPDPPSVNAVRQMLNNRHDRALEMLQTASPSNKKILQRLMPLLLDMAEGRIDAGDPQAAAYVYENIQQVESDLKPSVPLTISKMCFCREGKVSFGCYDTLPSRYEFRAGAGDQCGEVVRAYMELVNLSYRRQEDVYASCVTSKMEIRDAQDKKVFRHDGRQQIFRSRSPRNDVFLQCEFEIPPRIPPGTYSLWIEITDLSNQPPRSAHKSIELRIGSSSGPSMQKTP